MLQNRFLLSEENENLKKKVVSLENVEDLIGKSEAMKKVLKDIESVAQSNSSVVITGESGTGKELGCQGYSFQFSTEIFSAGKCSLRSTD